MRRNSANSSHKKAHKAQNGYKALLLLCLLSLLCLFVIPVRAQSGDVEKTFEQVATLIQDNRLAEAERALTNILRVTPNLPAALSLMGSVRAKQGRLAEAETLYLRAVQNDKSYTG